nr:uncharacterized protein LOC123768130 [Procambarus clarkii]
MLEHEPYQTPYHYTFHLTLRSPSPSPSRVNSRSPVSLNLATDGGKNDDANRDVNVVDKTADVPNRNMHGEAWSSKNHEDAKEQDIHHQLASEDKPDCNRDENSNKNDDCDFNLNFDSLLTYQCNNFGIIDCLNTVVKFQDSEQDDMESYCSDYENGLTTSPPRKFSDTESTIETDAVSSDVPLKGYSTSRHSFYSNKKPDLQTVRWKSCHELVNRDVTKTLLKRQTSEHSLMSVKEEKVLPTTSVAVYDYTESCSRYLDHGASNEGNKNTLQELPLCNTHNLGRANSAEYRNEQKTYEEFSREKFLTHNEAGENGAFCCHDSLVVDTSNSNLEEPMELDNYVMPPLTSSKQELSASWKAPSNLETSPNHPRKYTRNQTIYRSCDKENNAFRPVNPPNDYMHITCNRQINKENIKLVSKVERKSHLCYTEMDRVLGIQEDDGSGPGLSEDENHQDTFTRKECLSLEHKGVVSPHKLLWYLQKESQRHNNESSISRLHPLPSDTGKMICKAALIAPPDYRHYSYEEDIVREASRHSSACSHPSDVYPDLLQGDISG